MSGPTAGGERVEGRKRGKEKGLGQFPGSGPWSEERRGKTRRGKGPEKDRGQLLA